MAKRTLMGLGVVALVAGPVPHALATAPHAPVAAPPSPVAASHRPVIVGSAEQGTFHRGTVMRQRGEQPTFRRLQRAAAAGEHRLEVTVLNRDGAVATSDETNWLSIWPLDGSDPAGTEVDNGHGEGSLPAGDYSLNAEVDHQEADGTWSRTIIWLPKVTVTGDVSLTLDARTANPVQVTVDKAGARPAGTEVDLVQRIAGRRRHLTGTFGLAGDHLYVTPASAEGGTEYEVQSLLTQNGKTEGSPYAYNIASKAAGVPADLTLSARTKDLAAVKVRYASEGRPGCAGAHAGVDWGTGSVLSFYWGAGAVPTTRTEYYTPGLDWLRDEALTTADCAFDENDIRTRTDRFPTAGAYTRSWNKGPLGPADGRLILDTGNGTGFSAAMLSERGALSNIRRYSFLKGDSALVSLSGESIGQSVVPGYGRIWARPEPGRYTLTTNATRSAPWSDLATSQHVVWDVMVGQDDIIKLPTVEYRTALDDENRAPANTTQTLTLTLQQAKAGVKPTLWTSFDDGESWTPVSVSADGDRWTASFRNPAKGFVSLRTKIDGAVDQTVIRAYGLR
ncbi:hypothetical protein [Actinomadura logoneensis]|nr:hypothetical protein [Actinomadura logoneensis]